MTVSELIKELRKLPKDAIVFYADHDHGEYETAGRIGQAKYIDKDYMDEFYNDDDSGLSDCYKNTPQQYVIIRP